MKEALINHIIEHRTSYATDIETLKGNLKYEKLEEVDIRHKNWLIEMFKWEIEYSDELLKIILSEKNVLKVVTE